MSPQYTVVFCDDIREEVNGKLLLIGMYSGDLLPGSMPSNFPLSILIKAHGLTGKHKFEVAVTSPDGSNQSKMGGEIDVPGDVRAFPLIFVGVPIHVTRYGEITVDIALDDGEPTRIGTLAVSEMTGKPSHPSRAEG